MKVLLFFDFKSYLGLSCQLWHWLDEPCDSHLLNYEQDSGWENFDSLEEHFFSTTTYTKQVDNSMHSDYLVERI